ncbi:uncharacterized protein PGTG_21927 [Puccinia graminis f. sp. tritici CRL 75-36-700-3]|uniref:Uncharacterized protein n=1 Tax=Puccinia graminis f. sp. tritici (strain CRL 75-36-700-3 / race SCCL) TaxID=418459 RepID=H6QT47_PUCGT|nr:uncharacterized protein PGTG_21927 [Puccinia graminis f. sp. tritici CRL 75-36-700-3]EHS63996.1 hypothetical protein PGTG_21927 [Puccinia graminis f. sp. tritici CRL 75-36-700-3]
MSDETTPTQETSGSTRTADASDTQTAKDCVKSVFKIQHAAIIEAQAAEDRRQALEDRRTDRQILISAHQSNAARIARLEDLLLAMNIKNKANAHPVQPAPGRVDLQKFRTTRAGTLQSLFNFDAVASARLGDLQLAQFLVYGLTDAFQDRINERQLLETVPFAYGPFEKQANASFLALQRPAGTPASLHPPSNTSPNLSRDEFIWRVHSFLDSRGLCHFCKKHCGNVNGGCPGPLNRAHVDIPANYQAPTKLADYSAPRAWSSPSGPSPTPGKPTQPPAGQPSTRAASVAGVTDVTPLEAQVSALQLDAAIRDDGRWDTYFDDEGCYPSMEPAAVAALEDLDKQLLANEIEKADLADAIAGRPGRA